MNLEEWAAECVRLHRIVDPDDGLPPVSLRRIEERSTVTWRTDCGTETSIERSPQAAMQATLKALRMRIARKIEDQKKTLQDLLTLENEAALKMLETPETID